MADIRGRLRVFALCLIGLCLSGCLGFEKAEYQYVIEKDLSGHLIVHFFEVTSGEKTVEKQKKEMEDLYRDGYLEFEKDFQSEYHMEDGKLELLNKTDLECDARFSGKFHHLLATLLPILEEEDHEIKRKDDQFSFRMWMDAADSTLDVAFSIKYNGEVIEHNAHTYDENLQVMKWQLGEVDSSGVYFVLNTRK